MKVLKKINNNVALCEDSHGRELIAFGKGIGFPPTPYELTDLNKIDRTYYGIHPQYYDLLENIPEQVFLISSYIVDYARLKIEKDLNPNIVFTLSDHINFAIQRYQNHIHFKLPISHDIQYLYEEEMLVGKKAIEYINDIMKICLPKDEAVGIAMHFINAENTVSAQNTKIEDEEIVQEITKIIEHNFSIEINKNSFNYSRFVSHLYYLLKRKDENISINSQNQKLFDSMRNDFKDTYLCVLNIKGYLISTVDWQLSQEELFYLMLHINRLCAREDCNQ